MEHYDGISALGTGQSNVKKPNVKAKITFANFEDEIATILDRVVRSSNRINDLNEYIDPMPITDSGEANGSDLGLLNRLSGYCTKTMKALSSLEDQISRLEATIGKEVPK